MFNCKIRHLKIYINISVFLSVCLHVYLPPLSFSPPSIKVNNVTRKYSFVILWKHVRIHVNNCMEELAAEQISHYQVFQTSIIKDLADRNPLYSLTWDFYSKLWNNLFSTFEYLLNWFYNDQDSVARRLLKFN